MKSKIGLAVGILMLIYTLAACQPAPQAANRLPLPGTVSEAVLANFRQLTNTGRAVGPAWSPNGKMLAFTQLSFAPTVYSYRYSNAQPKTEIWEVAPDGTGGRSLDIGIVLFYSKDGSEIYYQVYDPTNNTDKSSVYAINPLTNKTRHFTGTEGFPNVQKLADGRLVLSEVGTYASLRIFDPTNGNRQTLMQEHPSNAPQDARLSPDGKLLAYSKAQALYLSKPDGSTPKLISDNGGFSARVWWSPDSQFLAYTTGSSQTDKLVLADRQGETKMVLIPAFTSGIVSSVDWSPDSRWMLVSTEAVNLYDRPTQVYLFDKAGKNKLLLESYVTASPAWSPDGHILALSLWGGPQADDPSYNIWLADLTDEKTAATLPPSPTPGPQPTPTRVLPSPGWPPELLVQQFWETINHKDYRVAWGMLSSEERLVWKFPDFKAFYECMTQVTVTSVQSVKSDEMSNVLSVKIDFKRDPDCNEMWKQSNDFYAVTTKVAPASHWQIECFNGTPDCVSPNP
jgi:Tol biopolymer transport system component